MHPLIGSQQEPYYDKDLFVPLDYVPLPTRSTFTAILELNRPCQVQSLRVYIITNVTRVAANLTPALS